jgi:hypothetical protein
MWDVRQEREQLTGGTDSVGTFVIANSIFIKRASVQDSDGIKADYALHLRDHQPPLFGFS